MRSLFELGRARAATGVVWSRISAPAADETVETRTETTAPGLENGRPSQ
jgi:hypothetical protein